MSYRTYDNELRLLQKRANERMRQLEKQERKSPAYRAIQARLEMMGKETKGSRGRRFSETGRGSYNEREHEKKILQDFLNMRTSTIRGARSYYDDVWETANADNKLTASGISREQWFDFFESLPDNKKDRMFYSQQVKIFKSFMRKNGRLVDEGKITVEEIAEAMQDAEKLDEVYTNLTALAGDDFTIKDVSK